MNITYKNKKLEKICTNDKIAERKYGYRMAEVLGRRIHELISSDTVEDMIRYKIGRCHMLANNREGQYAVDLVHPYRLVFEKRGNEIQIAHILEIVDYH